MDADELFDTRISTRRERKKLWATLAKHNRENLNDIDYTSVPNAITMTDHSADLLSVLAWNSADYIDMLYLKFSRLCSPAPLPRAFFASPRPINIRGVEQVHPLVHADIDIRSPLPASSRPRLEELVRRTKRPRTEAKLRHLQS